MATFTYSPDWAPTPELTPRLRSVRFGDGYEQRAPDGLNPVLPTWKLNFSVRSQAEAFAIYAWLLNNNAYVTPFDWAAPGQGTATAEPFGTGDGSRVTWSLVASGRRVNYTGTPTIYRTDWQGTQQLYAAGRTNYCPYSQSLDNAGWTKIIGGTGSNPSVTADYAIGPDGTFTAECIQFSQGAGTAVGDYSLMKTPTMSGLSVGQPVVVSFWAKSNTSAQNLFIGGGSVNGTNTTVSLTTTFQRFIVNLGNAANASGYIYFGLRGTFTTGSTADITITDFQVEQNGAGTATAYIPTLSAAVTRTDYSINATGVVTFTNTDNPVALSSFGTGNGSQTAFTLPSTPVTAAIFKTNWEGTNLLQYPTARTNYCFQSEDFSITWSKLNLAVTANSVAAPDGNTTADTLTDNGTNGYHNATCNAYANIPVADNSTLCASVWVKNLDAGYAFLQVNTKTPSYPKIVVNLSTGAIAKSSGTIVASGVQAYPGGWYRIWMAVNVGTGAGAVDMVVAVDASGTGTTYAGTGKSIYAWGAMAEVGSYPTPYIPTTTAAVTRTDYTLAGATVTFAVAPVSGATVSWSGLVNGAPPVGTAFTWTGTYTRKYVADAFTEPRPDTYGSWSMGATFREVVA